MTMETTKLLDSPELLKGPQATAFLGPRCFCPFPRERRSAWHQRRATEADVDCDGTGPGAEVGKSHGKSPNKLELWKGCQYVKQATTWVQQFASGSWTLLAPGHHGSFTPAATNSGTIHRSVYRYFVLILVCTNNYTWYNIIYIYICVCIYVYEYIYIYVWFYMYMYMHLHIIANMCGWPLNSVAYGSKLQLVPCP